MLPIIINAVAFYIGWWVCVSLGNIGAWVMLMMMFAVNTYLFRQPQREWWLWLMVGILGWFNDALLLFLGILVRPDDLWWPPFWLTCLWVLFAATLPYSLHGLVHKPRLFCLLCGFSGSLSYVAGVHLTEITWGVTEGFGWGLLWLNWLFIGYVLIKLVKLWRKKYFPYFITT